ncbi:helix-turn-helix transcriptional regulator [Mediterraneibacter sp. NSJ-55]|uniref:Helix-turn-helix transcriptional regulator n=2 Tax=Mediterraneibacter hominis TaxID=2763054 RepID=A0A923LKE2_9FIRM|nr:helix-turn-helix transcriptional regulator [Mediterraneibacter hominis]
MNTKEKILVAALRLFAVNGYEAVSVSQIAGELGITKGALYRHYKNKRDIFNCIFEYVCQLDVERSQKSGVPEKDYSEMPEAFSNVSAESIGDYMKAQFRYWSEDEIACNFRKMLTLEQYKSSEMNDLYQKVLVSGPLDYIENLFRELSKEQEKRLPSSHALAVEFYAPFYLLLSLSDGADCKEKKDEIAKSYVCYINDFFQKYFA